MRGKRRAGGYALTLLQGQGRDCVKGIRGKAWVRLPKEGKKMNSVVLIGKMVGCSEVKQRGRWQSCKGTISVSRPYKVKGEYKYDNFDFIAWGEYARRITTAKSGQIIGIWAMLERDDDKNIYLNIKGVTFYTNEMAEAIGSHPTSPMQELEDIGGFAAIAANEEPDF